MEYEVRRLQPGEEQFALQVVRELVGSITQKKEPQVTFCFL
jgi:hypothetical protein